MEREMEARRQQGLGNAGIEALERLLAACSAPQVVVSREIR